MTRETTETRLERANSTPLTHAPTSYFVADTDTLLDHHQLPAIALREGRIGNPKACADPDIITSITHWIRALQRKIYGCSSDNLDVKLSSNDVRAWATFRVPMPPEAHAQH